MTPRAKIEQIALYLGKPWKYSRLGEPSSWRFEIIDGSGRGLYLRLDKDRLKIGGLFPRQKCKPWSSDYHEIGVSLHRSAKDIAADIARRLLPDYLQSYETALLRYKEQKEIEEHINLIAQMIEQYANGRIAGHSRGRKTIYFDKGAAEIWSKGDVSLELKQLSPTQVIQIISMLKENNDP